ncbi:MAG: AraC family transcriptional regulator [Bacteroidota bacterium]
MPDTIPSYDSMAAFYAAIGGTMEQVEGFTVHRMEEVHAEAPYASPLFRANYYSIVLIRTGGGHYVIDEQTHPTQARTIYFTNPGHVKGFGVKEPTTGFVITFEEGFLKRYVHEGALDDFPFLIAEAVPPSYLAPEHYRSYDDLAAQLLREYKGASTYKFKVLGSLLVVLLLKLREDFWDTYDPLREADDTTDGSTLLVRTFKRNLEAHFRALVAGDGPPEARALPQVQDLAAAQHLHPSYFSTVVRRKTGRSVNAWIAEKATAEAQALLARTEVPVKEVAYRLGFKEPGHFSRYFKKHTGQTPTAFRAGM